MAQTAMTIRMDQDLKVQFDALCNEFGMSTNTAINIFARAVVRKRRIPFVIEAPAKEDVVSKGKAAFDELRRIVERDYGTFSGFALERWFRERLLERGGLTRLGAWWDRKGENEIDLVAANETDRRAIFCEVKRDASRISLPALRKKAEAFFAAVPEWTGWRKSFKGFSLDDM